VPQFSFIPTGDPADLADDVSELFRDLESALGRGTSAAPSECHPSLDVVETEGTVEVVVDVAGVPREALRVLFRNGVLLIAGEKTSPPSHGDNTFHLVEREFGRFARAVRLTGAFDVEHGTAVVAHGELTVIIPKMPDRRGEGHPIPVTSA
jgi:HSP20 family protein